MPLSDKDYFDQLQRGFFGVIAGAGGADGFERQAGGTFGAVLDGRPDAIVRALTWVMAIMIAQYSEGDERRRTIEDQHRLLEEYLKIADDKLASRPAGPPGRR